MPGEVTPQPFPVKFPQFIAPSLKLEPLAATDSTESSLSRKVIPDPRFYDEDAERLMRKRGIIEHDQTIQSALERTVGSLLDIDADMHGAYDEEFAQTVISLTERGVLVYGTPVLTNAGRKRNVTAACTVLPIELVDGQVDMESFHKQSAKALEDAVGTGYDLSDLERPSEAIVELNTTLDKINTGLINSNKRPVASMATLRADHPDIVNFIRAKRDADFSKWRFNISVFVTEELFQKAMAGEDWHLYDTSGETTGSLPAAQLLQEIAESAHYCGEPGILFKDRIDADNPTPQWEYKSTAPCAEVAMAEGEACQFSYINLATLVDDSGQFDQEQFKLAVKTMTRLLDASVEHTIREAGLHEYPLVSQKRRIGVGVTGFADLLVRLKIPYDSADAVEMAVKVSEALDFYSKDASADLAQKRGVFPAYQQSRYTDVGWLGRKLDHTQGFIPHEEWQQLFSKIITSGIRHASTTSMPPTGTSSAIVASSKSLEPLFSLTDRKGMLPRSLMETLSEDEQVQVLGRLALQGEMLGEDGLNRWPFLRTARQLSPAAHMEVQDAFQRFLDESLAKTVNLGAQSTVEDVSNVLMTAYNSRLKGVTVFRDGCLSERTSIQS